MGVRIDFLGLTAFVAIADHGGFGRAAGALNLSQTALSHRLRKIEEDLGAPLLIRSSREVSLTPVGQELLPEARRLLKELHDLYDAARGRAERHGRRLTFACLPTLAGSALPEVLGAFGAAHPGVAVEVLDMPVTRIAEAVRAGAAEFGVTIASAELADLRVRPLVEEDYVLMLPESDPLAARRTVARADLAGRSMVRISSQSRNRQLVDVALGEHRDRMVWHYETQSAVTALRLVAAGAAMTILPRSAASLAPPGVAARPFGDVRLSRTLGVVTRRGVPLSGPADALLEMIEGRFLAGPPSGRAVVTPLAGAAPPG